MQKLEFVRLERKVNYQDENEVYIKFYSGDVLNSAEKGLNKDKLYMILTDAYGIPHAFEIGKKIRKYTSGKVQSPVMIERIGEALKIQEFFLDDNGAIENLDKILKKAIAETGY